MDLVGLDERFDVPVGDAPSAIRETANRFLDSLAGLDELHPTAEYPLTDDRRWREPTDDPSFDDARTTLAADVTRLPAVTIPNGTREGLPIGLQLVGGAFEGAALLGSAAAVERALPG